MLALSSYTADKSFETFAIKVSIAEVISIELKSVAIDLSPIRILEDLFHLPWISGFCPFEFS